MRFFLAFVTSALVSACAIPDPGEIHLSECIRACNADADVCILGEEDVEPLKVCAHDLIECVAACIEEVEEQLK